ncbi:MAG: hypothetical protein M5R36_18315 [Deltaproteobacteria bacterium]|nr:hypothetical protein [Deltaproteobacteria bacterium]
MVATTLDSTSADIAPMAKSARMISMAKNMPAIGALKTAAMPPAAPHATSRRICSGPRRRSWPTPDPNDAPICAIGPSDPRLMPVPIEMALVTVFTAATRLRITPPLRATASITSGTPWPLASRAKKVCQRADGRRAHGRNRDLQPPGKIGERVVVRGEGVRRLAEPRGDLKGKGFQRVDEQFEGDRADAGDHADHRRRDQKNPLNADLEARENRLQPGFESFGEPLK